MMVGTSVSSLSLLERPAGLLLMLGSIALCPGVLRALSSYPAWASCGPWGLLYVTGSGYSVENTAAVRHVDGPALLL